MVLPLRAHKDAGGENSTFIVVGLGNPGREYKDTRHNVGFMVIDSISADLDIKISRVQSKALVGQGLVQGYKVILAKPQTYMNLSGQAVSGLLRFYKVPLDHLLVVHDDLDLPLGTLRMRPDGGSGGQKGLASIIQQLGTQAFPRLRIGIGRPPGRMPASDYVLQTFSSGDKETLQAVLDRAVAAANAFILHDLNYAMNQFNGALEHE
ncbi:MAG: aminoacyl-tRNA hydrolase [Chloroflexi bacterium]|nr:aminoacyl-tRNA hydrolase [Chloroflexota bacterium]